MQPEKQLILQNEFREKAEPFGLHYTAEPCNENQ